MQTAIVQQSEPQHQNSTIQSIHEDRRIRSVIVRAGNSPLSDRSETYSVTDLLRDASYVVRVKKESDELIFQAKNEHVVITLEPGSDLSMIADYVTDHLDEILASN